MFVVRALIPIVPNAMCLDLGLAIPKPPKMENRGSWIEEKGRNVYVCLCLFLRLFFGLLPKV